MIRTQGPVSGDRALRTELEEAQAELKRIRAELDPLRAAVVPVRAELEQRRRLLPPDADLEALRAARLEAEGLQQELARLEAELARREVAPQGPDPGLVRSLQQSEEQIRALERKLERASQRSAPRRRPGTKLKSQTLGSWAAGLMFVGFGLLSARVYPDVGALLCVVSSLAGLGAVSRWLEEP